jgi:hypothetical protein
MSSMPSTSGLNYPMHLYPLTRKLSDLRKLPVPTKSIILLIDSIASSDRLIDTFPSVQEQCAYSQKQHSHCTKKRANNDAYFGFARQFIWIRSEVCLQKRINKRAVRHTINLLADTHHGECFQAGLSATNMPTGGT